MERVPPSASAMLTPEQHRSRINEPRYRPNSLVNAISSSILKKYCCKLHNWRLYSTVVSNNNPYYILIPHHVPSPFPFLLAVHGLDQGIALRSHTIFTHWPYDHPLVLRPPCLTCSRTENRSRSCYLHTLNSPILSHIHSAPSPHRLNIHCQDILFHASPSPSHV